MRIAYLGDPSNPHTRRWVNHFSNLGHSCAIFCDPPILKPFEGVEIICPRMGLARKAIAFKLVHDPYSNNRFKAGPYGAAVRRWHPDIIHGFEALEYGYSTVAWRGVPRVLTPWGRDIFDWPKKSKLASFLVRRALRGATVISTNAPGLEDFLEIEYGIDPVHVECFSWGMDSRIFHPNLTEESQAFARRAGVPEGARVVLSPRTMEPYWGVGLLADALGQIVQRVGPNVVAVFLRDYGDGDYEAELRNRISAAGLTPNARFVSEPLEPSEFAAAFNLAELFFSAPETDLLAVSILEGMACGCPPVLADLPYYHCRVQDNENGFFLKERTPAAVADTIVRAMAEPQRLADIGRRNAEQIAKTDDWRQCARKMEEIYDWLVRDRGRKWKQRLKEHKRKK